MKGRLPKTWLGWAVRGVIALLVLWLVYTVSYRLFFQGQDVKRAEGTAVVAEEQIEAGETIATETLNQVRKREIFRETVKVVVDRGKGEIDEAWQGTEVEADIDAAGAAALCELHDDLCRDAGPEAMQ